MVEDGAPVVEAEPEEEATPEPEVVEEPAAQEEEVEEQVEGEVRSLKLCLADLLMLLVNKKIFCKNSSAWTTWL